MLSRAPEAALLLPLAPHPRELHRQRRIVDERDHSAALVVGDLRGQREPAFTLPVGADPQLDERERVLELAWTPEQDRPIGDQRDLLTALRQWPLARELNRIAERIGCAQPAGPRQVDHLL